MALFNGYFFIIKGMFHDSMNKISFLIVSLLALALMLKSESRVCWVNSF